jgi:uncharacterized membrane protein YfcA
MTLSLPDLSALEVAMVFGTTLMAYVVFGATGFGSSIISVPILAHILPLTFLVPMVCTLDLFASVLTGVRRMRQVDRREIGRLLPFMLVGIVAGVTLLVRLPAEIMLFALGAFVALYGSYNLLHRREWRSMPSAWSLPFGFLGGVFSAIFGTGGPIYVIYLAARLNDKAALRATVATVVAISAVLRTGTFAASGLLFQPGLLVLAALVLPVMLAGLWVGNHVHHRLPREKLVQLISLLLVGNGITLLVRSLSG